MKKKQKESVSKYLAKRAYIDASLFISAASDIDEHGEKARAIIEKIKNGQCKPYTASLAIDEVMWVIQKERGRELALETANTILSIPSLELVAVDREMIKDALIAYKEEKLNPRDAIHLAAMRSKKIIKMISSDADFDNIKDIERIDFTKIHSDKILQKPADAKDRENTLR